MVLTTHTPSDAERCDKVVVLAPGGRLAFSGPDAPASGPFRQWLLLTRRNADILTRAKLTLAILVG